MFLSYPPRKLLLACRKNQIEFLRKLYQLDQSAIHNRERK